MHFGFHAVQILSLYEIVLGYIPSDSAYSPFGLPYEYEENTVIRHKNGAVVCEQQNILYDQNKLANYHICDFYLIARRFCFPLQTESGDWILALYGVMKIFRFINFV